MNQHTPHGPGDKPEGYQAHDTYDAAYDEPGPGFEPGFDPGGDLPEPPHPINWNLLSADDLEAEWLELNKWVHWLRRTYGLPASVVPPFWHHHPELVWELSALHLHWLGAYDPEQNASAPIGWHRDFADARARLREWVAASGTRLDRDRPTRQTSWPGEDPAPPVEDLTIEDRESEFVDFVMAQVAERRRAEDEFFRHLDDQAGGP
ncbi:hypothetical protein [Nesterenkonia sphaerica]|uniref:hypothetical protein n=1 Tax=Nesterenkonia sphaerica TaxID=1804988 RepID=UPI001FB85D4B|nr:hypothetical protein [Nesterenkonia sphaerica]